MMFTRNDVIDIDVQNVLKQIGENDTTNCFAIGDYVNRSWENAIKNGWVKPVTERGGDFVTKKFICASAAYYLSNKSARTVRYYADVAAFFGTLIRDEFDMLSFSHFAHARKYDDWPSYLCYARSGGKDGGIVSVEGCEAEWKHRHKESLSDLPDVSTSDEDPPQTENKFSFANVCAYAVNLVDRFRNDSSVQDGPRRKLVRAIQLINEAIEESKEPMVK